MSLPAAPSGAPKAAPIRPLRARCAKSSLSESPTPVTPPIAPPRSPSSAAPLSEFAIRVDHGIASRSTAPAAAGGPALPASIKAAGNEPATVPAMEAALLRAERAALSCRYSCLKLGLSVKGATSVEAISSPNPRKRASAARSPRV